MSKKQLTVKQLKEKLSGLDDDLIVMVKGYEGGWHIATDYKFNVFKFKHEESEWWYGDYETVEDPEEDYDIKGIIINSGFDMR